ncbi:LuxR C-terminal-related transcriptional regulator [Streptomyces sp. MUM 178J]|uniref:LuxR C-terminal-related transcriptional regulator n=1 Tax=Streptomyces sp. MUM 178J TaxID=2791991 RepID=UPI001F049CBD|nr:LuxR C-terminal-related transcriptional regulator [Streptomyces sp. MUM 178J]WRQ78170.1 LuxR C-terminal-related transcriptional regulator [Streptomyces sp. MUM 178J]
MSPPTGRPGRPPDAADRRSGPGRVHRAALLPGGDPADGARLAVPGLPSAFVRRQRLTRRLTAGAAGPLVLITGPAGAGKTLLAAHWAASSAPPAPVAWLTLEPEDDAPGVFWAGVLTTLGGNGSVRPEAVGSPVHADEVDPSLLARLAAQLSRRTEPVILVLDAYDHISSPEVAAGLQSVLRHAAPGLRLVLTSRSEPLLPLHRYRAASEITEIRGADLAFTPDETARLLRGHGLSLPADAADALTARTEGWAAGLRLSALAARDAADPAGFLAGFEAGHTTIADYLLAEVLGAQPEAVQDLLLRTSVLDRTCPDLADALTGRGDAEGVLADLARSNALVEPIGHGWYRHHALFAEILRVHLRARHPGLDTELHRRAGRWLGDAGRIDEALPHAAAAGDWEWAATRFVEDLAVGRLFTGLDADRLTGLFSAMPPAVPGLAACLVRAGCALARYDLPGGLEWLRGASGEEAAATESAEALISRAFLWALAGRLTGSAGTARTAVYEVERAALRLPEGLRARRPELFALPLAALGSALLWERRLDAARQTLHDAGGAIDTAGAAEAPETVHPRYEALSRLALVDVLHGLPGPAQAHARQALAVAEQGGLAPRSRTGVAHLVLAAVALDRDDPDAARGELDRAAESSGAHHDPVAASAAALWRSRLLLAEGDPLAALAALDGARPPATAHPSPWVFDHAAVVRSAALLALDDPHGAVGALGGVSPHDPLCAAASARARLAAGDAGAALALLDALPRGGGRDTGPGIRVRLLLARAETLDRLGDPAGARSVLAQALAAARPDRLRLPFRESGPSLRLLRRRPDLAWAHAWLGPAILGGLPAPHQDGDAAPPVLEPLSERERQVLERAAQMLSTQEIADELHLSVNTVKTHLKSVHRKLSARRRGEAVRRARELRLL